MAKKKVAEEQPTVQSIAGYIKKYTAKTKPMPHHHGESTREAEYKGHKIIIRTTYEITVDGQAVTGHINVSNEGDVQYHAIPNFSFGSAVDLGVLNSRMSAPLENALPAPMMMTALTPASTLARSIPATRPARSS